jgi:hypothetical protein
MTIKVIDAMQDDLMQSAWDLYYNAFHELNALAVQRHLMYRSEFDAVMLDPKVDKYLFLDDDGVLCGMSTYTNCLDAVPLISPQFFQRRWPQHYADGRIWYVGFVAVNTAGRAANAFVHLVTAMQLVAAEHSGVVCLDMCRYNDDEHRMSRAVRLLVRRITSDVHVERMDEQSYWTYEFPAAA